MTFTSLPGRSGPIAGAVLNCQEMLSLTQNLMNQVGPEQPVPLKAEIDSLVQRQAVKRRMEIEPEAEPTPGPDLD